MIATNVQSNAGLCWTCNNVQGCYHHARRGPALFCELFDNYAAPDAILAGLAAPPRLRPFGIKSADEGTLQQAGLCGNCDHAARCSHSMQEGGIWHCEDYQ